MSTIWILNDKSQRQNVKIFRNESQLLKNISKDSDQEILEYELKSSIKSKDYFKTKDRDIQLRSCLGELSKSEESIINLISMYESIAPENKFTKKSWNGTVIGEFSQKQEMIETMKKYQSDKKSFSQFIINNKKHFINDVSHSVDWYIQLLKVHNFMNHIFDLPKWDRESKQYIATDSASEDVKSNFILAKKGLRKKK